MAEERATQVGDIETKFGRHYTFINPNANLGPGTWRLSMPEEYTGGGGGGGVGGSVPDHDGVPPIVVDTRVDPAGGNVVIETSMDITKLDPR